MCEGREERGVEGGNGREGVKRNIVTITKMVLCSLLTKYLNMFIILLG